MHDSLAPGDTPAAVLAARARQGETLESIGRLSGGIAHEFNNLLTAIFGYSELLDDQLRLRGGTAAERSDLQEIRTAAERAFQLTQRLLAFSRRLPTVPRRIDANQVALDMERLLQRFVPPQVEVVMTLTPDDSTVVADPAQLERVLLCLAVNACDAMPAGGRLTIGSRWQDVGATGLPAGDLIGVPVETSGVYLDLSVADTGSGMTADFIHQAFEPFVTTKNPAAGAGLGLSEVYGLVVGTGGAVVVQSEPGHGTVVHVLLPHPDSPRSPGEK